MDPNAPAKLPDGWHWKGKPATNKEHFEFEMRFIFGDDNYKLFPECDLEQIRQIVHYDLIGRLQNVFILDGIKK